MTLGTSSTTPRPVSRLRRWTTRALLFAVALGVPIFLLANAIQKSRTGARKSQVA